MLLNEKFNHQMLNDFGTSIRGLLSRLTSNMSFNVEDSQTKFEKIDSDLFKQVLDSEKPYQEFKKQIHNKNNYTGYIVKSWGDEPIYFEIISGGVNRFRFYGFVSERFTTFMSFVNKRKIILYGVKTTAEAKTKMANIISQREQRKRDERNLLSKPDLNSRLAAYKQENRKKIVEWIKEDIMLEFSDNLNKSNIANVYDTICNIEMLISRLKLVMISDYSWYEDECKVRIEKFNKCMKIESNLSNQLIALLRKGKYRRYKRNTSSELVESSTNVQKVKMLVDRYFRNGLKDAGFDIPSCVFELVPEKTIEKINKSLKVIKGNPIHDCENAKDLIRISPKLSELTKLFDKYDALCISYFRNDSSNDMYHSYKVLRNRHDFSFLKQIIYSDTTIYNIVGVEGNDEAIEIKKDIRNNRKLENIDNIIRQCKNVILNYSKNVNDATIRKCRDEIERIYLKNIKPILSLLNS